MKKYKDYYKILGVARDASLKTIKQAYRKRALTYHPDVNKASYAEERFKEINEAHEVLSDPKRRAAYDQRVRQEEEKRRAAEAQAEQERREKEAKQREAEQAASPEQGTAPPDLEECPLCGKHNLKTNTFRCRQCGRDNLCLRHQDQHSFLCTFCEDELARKRQKAESGEAGHKPASAAGWKKPRTGLAFALLCLFLGGGAWWITLPWRATTRLLEVAGHANLEEVQALLAAGANVLAKDEGGRTALMDAARENKNPEVIKALLAAGAEVNAKDYRSGITALVLAGKNSNSEVAKALLAAGADVHAAGEDNMTDLLMGAAKNWNPEEVKALLAAGADVNAKRWLSGSTALMAAADRDRNPEEAVEVIKVLLAAGADVNARMSSNSLSSTALMEAAKNWNPEVAVEVIKVLLAAGADVNAKDEYGMTALMYAVRYRHPEKVKALLAAGADVNAKDKYGMTALMFAEEHWHSEVIKLLQAAGAKK